MYRTADFAELQQAVPRHVAAAIVHAQAVRGTCEMPVESPSADAGQASRPLAT